MIGLVIWITNTRVLPRSTASFIFDSSFVVNFLHQKLLFLHYMFSNFSYPRMNERNIHNNIGISVFSPNVNRLSFRKFS